MNLSVKANLVIPANEIQWRFSRSSGAGGQNVNKTESKVEIVFNVYESKALANSQKLIIFNNSNNRIINGCICIVVQEKRTQLQNRQLALKRLASTLRDLLKAPPKVRTETKPTRSSQKRRLDSKRKRGDVKKNRKSQIEY